MKLAIIDFNRTIYDPETNTLVPGATEVLEFLADKKFTLVLISKKEAGRSERISNLGLNRYFAEMIFVDNKTPQLFREILSRYGADPAQTYVLGDHLHQEMYAGNVVGAKTIHLKRGKFAGLKPHKGEKPWKTITQLIQITELF